MSPEPQKNMHAAMLGSLGCLKRKERLNAQERSTIARHAAWSRWHPREAKVALAFYRAYGRVPRENEIDEVYYITRILKRVLGTLFLRKHYKPTGQLALF